MSESPHQPIRTCIGCRGKAPRSELVRLVRHPRDAMRVRVDERATAPGRGAWLHPDQDCLDQAERRRAIGRALRIAGPAEIAEVTSWFTTTEVPGTSGQTIDEESGLEADGHPMSTQR